MTPGSIPSSRGSELGAISVPAYPSPRTVIVLLNWNGAEDSIECIQSLLRLEDQDFLIVLCDNNSTDSSFRKMLVWGEAELESRFATWTCGQSPPTQAKLILIQNGMNLGFAGGCNVGIRYALLHTRAEFVWLLNNDTIVEASSLGHQVAAMRQRSRIGILGSTLIYFDNPACLQAAAGYDFNFWTARVLPLAVASTPSSLPLEHEIEPHLKYISGASMFVRRDFLETVGLLNEQYFLYFEEIDWAFRAQGRFKLGYCAPSTIWHKEGRSIGSHANLKERSSFSEAYLSRNRVLFLKTWLPWRLSTGLVWILLTGVFRILQGRRKLAWVLWKGALNGLRAPVKPLPVLDQWPESMRRETR